MDKNTKIRDVLMSSYSCDKNYFRYIDPDYTFGEFYDALKNRGDIISRLHIDDEDVLRETIAKIEYVSASKFRFTAQFKEHLPLIALSIYDIFERVLQDLTENKGYSIWAHDTHRWISTDGWYELEYELHRKDIKNIYLTTYCSYEQSFEDEWKSDDIHTGVYYRNVYMNDYNSTPTYTLERILENEKARQDIQPDVLKELDRRFNKKSNEE